MSGAYLPCDQSPLHWPSSVDLKELNTCDICAIELVAPFAGPLEVVSRNTGDGVGDGVSIIEHPSVTMYYKHQQYSIEDTVFHTPGLHIFPGETRVYPAEYHIHMKAVSAPIRYVTLVIPASHRVPENQVTEAYFAAMRKPTNPSKETPALETLIAAVSSNVLQYLGPDLRGRVYSNRDMSGCVLKEERQFFLVTKPAYIKASDLERIPREGSTFINNAYIPPLPVRSAEPLKKSLRDDIMRRVILATPGFAPHKKEAATVEAFEDVRKPATDASGNPLRLVRGNELVDVSGHPITLRELLGKLYDNTDGELAPDTSELNGILVGVSVLVTAIGFLIADSLIAGWIWPQFFNAANNNLAVWSIYKWFVFILVCFMPIIYYYLIKLNIL